MRTPAFVALLLTLATALPAQESTRARRARLGADTLYRDPVSARVLGSIIPGAGHVYAGEYWNGVTYYYGTIGLLGSGAFIYILDECTFSFFSDTPCKSPPAWPHQAAGIAIMAVGVGVWVNSVIDAGHAAERANERHPRTRAAVIPYVAPRTELEGANVGLSVAW